MEDIIRNANFFNSSEDDEDAFQTKVNDDRFDDLNAEQLNRILDVFAEKLKTDKWASRNEPGSDMLCLLSNRLRNLINNLDDDEVVEKVVPHIFNVCEVCIAMGMPSSYVEVQDNLLHVIPNEYFENMSRERMLAVMNLLRAGHYRAFGHDKEAEFAKDYCATYLRNYVIESIEEETMLEHLPLVVDAADFMIKAMMQGSADCQHYYDELFSAFKRRCGSHPLELLEPEKLGGYLLAYQDILDSREVFGKDVESLMEDTFGIVYRHLRGDDCVKVGPAIIPLANKLLARQSQRHKKIPWLKKTIKDLVSAFYGISEANAKEIFKSVDFKETLATLRPFLTTVDLETKDWVSRVEDMLRRGINYGIKSESDAIAFFEVMADMMAWRNEKVFSGLHRLFSDNKAVMKGAVTTDPPKFVATVVKISEEAASMFSAANDEADDDKKKMMKKAPLEMVSIVRPLLEAAELGLPAKDFFSAGPPLFSCPNTIVWRFIEDYLRNNEKKARAALKENKGACLECLRHAASLVKTFKGDEDNRHEYDLARAVGSKLEDFLKLTQSARALQTPEVQQFLLRMMVDIMRSANDNQAEVGCRLPEQLSWDKVGPLDDFFEALKFLTDPSSPVEQESTTWPSFLAELLEGLMKFASSKPTVLHPFIPTLTAVMECCLEEDFYFELSGAQMPTIHSFVLLKCTQVLQGECSDGALAGALFPFVLKASDACPPEFTFHQVFTAFRFAFQFKGEAAVAVCPYLEPVFDTADKCDGITLLSLSGFLRNMAMAAPEPMAAYSGRVTKLLLRIYKDQSLLNQTFCVTMVLTEMVKAKPEIVNPELITAIIPVAKVQMMCHTALELLDVAAQNKPALLRPHLKSLSEIAFAVPDYAPKVFDMFEYIGSEEKAQVEPVMAALETAVSKIIRTHAQQAVQALVVMRRLALTSPEPLRRREKTVKAWQQEPALHDYAQHLLDVIADRSLAGLDANITETAAAVEVVSTRLGETEDRVDVIDYEVHQHSAKIENLEERADETDERLDAVEKDVDEMGTEIEAIDQKTMTNAPKWSRKVSLLLNEAGERDWRLLAQRLGYGPEDIRGWAAQHDPCMAVLSEWYASRRAAGATHAVRQALRDMERLDALAVVEEAIDAAAGCVPDEPQEYATPPPVFLSYQWGHQPEAKLLCRHLEMAGYHVWMDVGQMGGGDKLFEAIDRGLRGAEVMIACVTEKYAASENCRRELNLAASVGKPIIPLQMHRMTWPPEGPMGPLLAEYLFIRVFSRNPPPDGAPFWPDERFRELLMQIRLHVAPDYEEVRPPYERWWEPPEELIVVPPRPANQATGGGKKEEKKEEESVKEPDVFISYQWGRQPQIRKLYSRLTGLGCHCWMDIAQMGGGDSLYDKIDRGIRACKVVIACVTPKYALSANCRKEVSLAHAVSKPIIPLLLEKCDWPPAGPMSMVFTELIYVGLHKSPEEQETWEGPKTEEILSKLREYGVLPALPEGKRPPSAVKNAAANAQPKTPALPPVTADTGPARPKSGAARRVSGAAGPISATGNRPKSSLTSPRPTTAKSPESAAKSPDPPAKSPEPAAKTSEPLAKSPEPPAKSPEPAKSPDPAGNGAVDPSEVKQSRSCSML